MLLHGSWTNAERSIGVQVLSELPALSVPVRASDIDVTDRRTDQARARVECSVMWVYTCPCSWHGMRPSNEGHQRGPVCVWVCVSPLVGAAWFPITNSRSTVHCDTSVPKINAAGRIIVGRGERKGNKNISICTCKARSQASAVRLDHCPEPNPNSSSVRSNNIPPSTDVGGGGGVRGVVKGTAPSR